MATFKCDMQDYINSLEKLGQSAEGTIKQAVYEGAAVVADSIRAALHEHRDTGALENSLALTRMQTKNDFTYTKVTFAGYDTSKRSTAFPQGVPNAVKAAALESGNSRGQKATHCISRATKSAAEAARKAMEKKFDEEIEKIMKS